MNLPTTYRVAIKLRLGLFPGQLSDLGSALVRLCLRKHQDLAGLDFRLTEDSCRQIQQLAGGTNVENLSFFVEVSGGRSMDRHMINRLIQGHLPEATVDQIAVAPHSSLASGKPEPVASAASESPNAKEA